MLSIVSGVYFGLSIYRIKKISTEKEDLVNSNALNLHAASFGIYMFSTIVSVVVLGLDAWYDLPYGYYIASDIFNMICSSLNKAIICYIFWKMDNIKVPIEEKNYEVYVEEVDENDDFQMRLWYQFMKEPEEEFCVYRSPQSARLSNISMND